MNILTQEARKKQEIVKQAIKNGKSYTSRKYGVSLSTLKRWCKKYDGTWQSMLEKSHRPHSHPNRHTPKEEKQIKNSFKKCYARYGWDGVYDDLLRKGYTRSFSVNPVFMRLCRTKNLVLSGVPFLLDGEVFSFCPYISTGSDRTQTLIFGRFFR